MPDKLLVISIDAMLGDDIPYARTLPVLGGLLQSAAVAEIASVYPTVTYPNHVAQVTGCYPATSGVVNNLRFQPGRLDRSDWFWDHATVRVPTLFAAARAAGRSTSALQWPATAGATDDIDTLVPEMWDWPPYGSLEAMYRAVASPDAVDRYVLPNLDLVEWEPKRRFNEFATTIGEQVIRDLSPDVMFVHLVEVDSVRHAGGPTGGHVEEALRKVDGWIGRLLAATEDVGTRERTDVVLVSDHGHLETEQHTNLNRVFLDRGLLRLHDDGSLADWDVLCQGAGLSGQLYLADDLPPARRRLVEEVLAEVQATPEYRIRQVWSAEQARERWHLAGDFTWVVESEPGVIVGMHWDRRPVVRRGDPDSVGYLGNHGHEPSLGAQPVFIASGPGFRPGADAGRRSIVDVAPTLAALLGLDLPTAEGRAMTELLAGAGVPA